jgi:hypothetical protein
LRISPPFDGYYFIDMNADKMAHLKRLCGGRTDVRLHAGDANAYLKALLPTIEYSRPRQNRRRSCGGRGAGLPLLGITTLAAIVLYLTVSAALYTFSAPLGEHTASTRARSAYALTIASLVGLAGAGAAIALNVRWGRTIPHLGVLRRLHPEYSSQETELIRTLFCAATLAALSVTSALADNASDDKSKVTLVYDQALPNVPGKSIKAVRPPRPRRIVIAASTADHGEVVWLHTS